jgi:hypothetical protein
VLDGFTGPFVAVTDTVTPPPGHVAAMPRAAGLLLRHDVNNGVIVVNRLLAAHAPVFWLTRPLAANDTTYPAGTIYIPASPSASSIASRAAATLGLSFDAVAKAPDSSALLALHPVRIGLWDRYGGSIPSGWVRWLFDQYEFPYRVVYPQELDAGGLAGKYDVLVFVDGALPSGDAGAGSRYYSQPRAEDIPAEYRDRLGSTSVEKTVPQLRRFLEAGGSVITIGSSTALAAQLGLPVASALVRPGTDSALGREQFYIPGSVLEARVRTDAPLAYGIPDSVAVLFDHSPAFRITGSGDAVRKVAWYDSPTPLRSGWAWGQKYLDGAVAVAEADVGKGKLFLFGPEITFRGQPHGTFGFLFNGIYLGGANRGGGATSE